MPETKRVCKECGQEFIDTDKPINGSWNLNGQTLLNQKPQNICPRCRKKAKEKGK